MTTYIGTAGHMVPIGCAATLDVATADRAIVTDAPLSGRRVRVLGPGPRSWQMDRLGRPAGFAVLESLARRQARYGGVYRVTPCDALEWNMLTPQATEDLAGWAGVALRTPSQVPAVLLTDGVYPGLLGRVAPGQSATSPRVPLVSPATLPKTGTVVNGCTWMTPDTALFDPRWSVGYAGLHMAGAGTMTVRTHNAAGSLLDSWSLDFAGPGGAADPTLTRHMLSFAPADEATSAELHVQAAVGRELHLAWPSIAYRDTPYVPGRGCDAAYLSPPQRSVLGTWGDGIESQSWTILEVGV